MAVRPLHLLLLQSPCQRHKVTLMSKNAIGPNSGVYILTMVCRTQL